MTVVQTEESRRQQEATSHTLDKHHSHWTQVHGQDTVSPRSGHGQDTVRTLLQYLKYYTAACTATRTLSYLSKFSEFCRFSAFRTVFVLAQRTKPTSRTRSWSGCSSYTNHRWMKNKQNGSRKYTEIHTHTHRCPPTGGVPHTHLCRVSTRRMNSSWTEDDEDEDDEDLGFSAETKQTHK